VTADEQAGAGHVAEAAVSHRQMAAGNYARGCHAATMAGRLAGKPGAAVPSPIARPAEEAMNEDVERFLEECRADAFFQNNPNAVDRIEDLLAKFYHEADESPAWQELWDCIREIITGKAPLVERFEELLRFLKKTFG
jgi:hypothetical protein